MAGRYELPEGAWPLIADLFERKKTTGPPRTQRLWLLGDKGYDSDGLCRYCGDHGIYAVIPYPSISHCITSVMLSSVCWGG